MNPSNSWAKLGLNWLLPAVVALIILWLSWNRYLKILIKKKVKKLTAYLLNMNVERSNKLLTTRKKELFSPLDRMAADLKRPIKLLEIGAGGGANFLHYPENTEVICLEPIKECHDYIFDNAKKYPGVRLMDVRYGKAEDMSEIEDESQDACVSTHVLCSVKDVEQALREIQRILRPGGKFVYFEHIKASGESWASTFQRLVRVPFHWIAGCDLAQQTDHMIRNAGFKSVDMNIYKVEELMDGVPKPLWYFIYLIKLTAAGTATK